MAVNPFPGMLLYPRIRKSPFFYASRQHGVAQYSVYNHTYHPRNYGDPVGEYWHLLNAVTLWDVGVERQVEITGPDAFDFTNMLVPTNAVLMGILGMAGIPYDRWFRFCLPLSLELFAAGALVLVVAVMVGYG